MLGAWGGGDEGHSEAQREGDLREQRPRSHPGPILGSAVCLPVGVASPWHLLFPVELGVPEI